MSPPKIHPQPPDGMSTVAGVDSALASSGSVLELGIASGGHGGSFCRFSQKTPVQPPCYWDLAMQTQYRSLISAFPMRTMSLRGHKDISAGTRQTGGMGWSQEEKCWQTALSLQRVHHPESLTPNPTNAAQIGGIYRVFSHHCLSQT